MSMINNTRLTEFVNGLWAKIKQRYDVTIKDATYNKTTQELTLTKVDDTTTNVELTDLVSKTEKNVISGETLITDGYILGSVISKLDNQQTNMHAANIPHYMGYKAARINPSQTLTHITIGIHSSIAVGSKVSGIKVAAVKVSDNTITSYVINDETAYVQENINPELSNCDRSVVLGLSDPFTPDEDTWFCITCPGAMWGERAVGGQGHGSSEQANMPQIGQAVRVKSNGYIGKYLLHAEKLSLNNIVDSIGAVKSVNNVSPDGQGRVTLNAEHFQDIYSKTEVDGKFVLQTDVANEANKIPRLDSSGKLETSILPKISINDTLTFTRNTQSEAETIAMQQTVENGDMMVLIVGASSNNRVTKKYLCVDATQNTFAERFIELTFPTDGITEGELNTILQRYVLTSDTGTAANQVLRLDAQGKIDDNNLKIATSEEINAIINALQ